MSERQRCTWTSGRETHQRRTRTGESYIFCGAFRNPGYHSVGVELRGGGSLAGGHRRGYERSHSEPRVATALAHNSKKEKKKKTQTMPDTRSEKREAKYVSLQTFSVCSYITLAFGGVWRCDVGVSNILGPPPVYHRDTPPPPPAVCGRLLWEQMRPRTTTCGLVPRRVLRADGHLWKTKAALWTDGETRSLSGAASCIRGRSHRDEASGRHDHGPLCRRDGMFVQFCKKKKKRSARHVPSSVLKGSWSFFFYRCSSPSRDG